VIVVDASVALAWCLADEADEIAERVLDRVAGEGATAPSHWPLEVANGLLSAERRGRLDAASTDRARELLADLAIEVVPVELSTATGSVLDLARRHDLGAYDAVYLALAWFRGLPLASLDDALRRAARAEDVELAA
jgi:predicted nucleic acid-binding protein